MIQRTCNTCQVAQVEYAEEMLGGYERDQEARYYREGRYAQ